ncbi:RNA-binding protein [Diaporthe amygdali]|uniref:RNA-binding protein n=1 Tax=Phomopsis amygdali TaxID=1214568 RepID=UPI0022FF3C77|nr:RNA-binding protein [Diaporthe amygdali]KAJ0108635.1 RNA-binding protein [Diaporthe amygdali]
MQHNQVLTHAISEDLFESAVPVPGSKKKRMVYPLAPVQSPMFTMSEYESQFEVVQEKLKEIVDKDEVLRLRDNFYCHSGSKRFRKSVAGSTNMPPPFRLVYWADNCNPYVRCASETALQASFTYSSTFCGSPVSFKGRSATLALTLEVDSVDIVLTAGHLKGLQEDLSEISASSYPEGSDSDQLTLNEDDYVEVGPLWVDDDDEYEVEAVALQPLPPQSLPLDCRRPECTDSKVMLPLQMMRPKELSVDLGPNAPDLDWMPLECDYSTLRSRRRNLIYLPDQPEPIMLKQIANEPRIHAVPVFVVSGVRGVIKAVLPGESGSLVVDQDTFSVYGHVVGSDRLGYALVVPLCDTIRQVRSAFKATSVHLPQEAKPVSAACFCDRERYGRWPGSPLSQEPHERPVAGNLCTDLTGSEMSLFPRPHFPRMVFIRDHSIFDTQSRQFDSAPTSKEENSAGSPRRSLPEEVLEELSIDQGLPNLVEFWKTTTPPRISTDIREFWESLMKLAQGLHAIHETITDDDPRAPHMDIEPRNILVSTRNDRPHFKFATMGFEPSQEPTVKAAQRSASRRSQSFSPCAQLDVWSLGCVFSEALAWSLGSSEFVHEFEYQRASTRKVSAGLELQDMLHEKRRRVHWPPLWAADGSMPEVMEAELKDKARQKGDVFAPALLPVIKQMLKPPEERPSAIEVYIWSMEALSKAASQPHKEVSVGEVIQWIHGRKKSCFLRRADCLQELYSFGRRSSKGFMDGQSGPGEITESEYIAARGRLKDREQVFLVDDSSSMKCHWEEVTRTLRALAYIAKSVDPEGIELCFSSSPEEQTWPKSRPITVYVLTDGKWINSSPDWQGRLEQQVASLPNDLRRGQFSIHFIHFGSQNTEPTNWQPGNCELRNHHTEGHEIIYDRNERNPRVSEHDWSTWDFFEWLWVFKVSMIQLPAFRRLQNIPSSSHGLVVWFGPIRSLSRLSSPGFRWSDIYISLEDLMTTHS